MKTSDLLHVYEKTRVRRDVGELLNLVAKDKLGLDVGCANYEGEYGVGVVYRLVLARCVRCVGLDINPLAVLSPKRCRLG